MALPLPRTGHELTAELLTELISEQYPGVKVEHVDILEVKNNDETSEQEDGQNGNSARAYLNVAYAGNSNLPTQLMVKMSQSNGELWYSNLHTMYATEVDFYRRLRPGLDIEAPMTLGARMDPNNRFVLILEDLRPKNAGFRTVLDADITADTIRGSLDTLARLHASFWESPRFETDLAWVNTHVDGPLEDLMRGPLADAIRGEIQLHQFKREFLGIMGTTEEELRLGTIAVKEYQATLPRTLLHGDTHLGNMYILPENRAGLIDFQLVVRGHVAHDIAYNIIQPLPVETRRREDRNLVDFYLERLKEYGVKNAPNRESLWREYRRAAIWGVYFGWFSAPIECFGWEHSVVALQRVVTAYQDLGTRELVAELL